MLASLPMYDRPQTARANDRLWAAFRDCYSAPSPKRLRRGGDTWDHWRDPELVLSQTCGLPYRAGLHRKVSLVATPVYAGLDCAPGHYFSVYVAHKNDTRNALSDFKGARLAYNDPLSQSGWAAIALDAAREDLVFSEHLQTGSHRASAGFVAEGRADIASLDALTWQMIQNWDDIAQELRVIGQSAPSPGLPYITGRNSDAKEVARALGAAFGAVGQRDRSVLGISGLTYIAQDAYLALPKPEFPPIT